MASINVGVDIGGTFTDFVFLDEQGNRSFGKTVTTYPDPSHGFIDGLEKIYKNSGIVTQPLIRSFMAQRLL
ncbi:hydantoinase/oxoprolinase N-terminal domain-containing protein [Salicibibacter kimchii]|uniref:Hydantoinase/oxoprolinase N-terminal domain-containing protein n=1 Tax=Salicibibacter kimchii TaxID=2099786 RepID=A0A345BZG4_9BACI|nr:hydantoinase/oxoprolinase N-terminal domain-containing protein [Salicibibacter kimchii]AXF56345.1 hypothetical protein DT065_10160 [Salicibibacter kimchii]